MGQIGEHEEEINVPEPLVVPEKFPEREPIQEPAPIQPVREPVHT